jgi:hypothetical protein
VSPEPVDWLAKGTGFLRAKFTGRKYGRSWLFAVCGGRLLVGGDGFEVEVAAVEVDHGDMDWVLFPVFYWVTGVALV